MGVGNSIPWIGNLSWCVPRRGLTHGGPGMRLAHARGMTKFLSHVRNSLPVMALTFLIAGSCASASGVRLGMQTYPAQLPDHEVPIFESLQELPRKSVKVGRIVGEGCDLASFRQIVGQMQQRVRELGGDALVLTGGGLLLLKGTDFGVDTNRTVHGLAVRWQTDELAMTSRGEPVR
jgi:hypothetical protein